ncbi:hypothetical protein U27_02265 [Candidatus Vecturithrix granuli]|uniref:ABC-type transport auxiliary lipoprotein component domain-containing protein n=1 Tax=Vecturithrix granuli TaxID=1499967 RepID=A0A0S6W705_VECG1|nr:hypothetical protein U27_02265 [Candidatus Vecturithrix granuli]
MNIPRTPIVSDSMKKQRLSRITALWWGILVVLSGCASVPPTHYYTFQPIPVIGRETPSSRYPASIGIEAYEAETPYQQDRIVFRKSPYEVNFYEYHRWLRPPAELVTDQVQKLLKVSGLFQQIQAYTYDSTPDYLLRGRILLFDQWYNGKGSSVRIGIHYQFVELAQEQILWSDVIETTATVPTLNIVETVKGFESAVQENISQALASIDKVLAHKE